MMNQPNFGQGAPVSMFPDDPSMQMPPTAAGPAQAQPMPGGGMMVNGQRLDPKTVEAILALSKQPTQQKQLDQQMKLANAMRSQGVSGVQATSPGGGRVGAPNWAQAIANVYAGYKGTQMQKEAEKTSNKLAAEREAALRQYYDSMTAQQLGGGV